MAVTSNPDLYSVKFVGVEVKVTVTSRAKIVKQWLFNRLNRHDRNVELNHLVVGLGVEPTTAANKPANTLQMCVERKCLIFQLAHTERVPRKLRRFMKDRSYTFVGFKNGSDRGKLESSRHQLKMRKEPLDLTDQAAMDDAPVDELLMEAHATVRERRMSRKWKRKRLTRRQVEYATVNAYFAYRLGRNIKVWNM